MTSIISNSSTGQHLTKSDIQAYYADPQVQKLLLQKLKNRDLMSVMVRSPEQRIYKRYVRPGQPLRVRNEEELARRVSQHYVDFHPTVGEQTREVWVDIDAGKGLGPEQLKAITQRVYNAVEKMPEVQTPSLAFSGGSGYYVKGQLNRRKSTSYMRERLRETLRPLTERENVTFGPPGEKEIRLDLSTLHPKGSIRAPYSLNSETGLVSLPIPIGTLAKFKANQQATPAAVVEKLRYFAPGVPAARKIQSIPTTEKSKHWTLAVQEHKAKRAGKHWDLRLVDPSTGYAHSWAIPRSRFPEAGKPPLLAVQTPTHTADYALNFGLNKRETIGKGYGQGTVEIKHKEPVKVLSSGPERVKFERIANGKTEKYVLFRTRDTSWLLRNMTKEGSDMNAFSNGYQNILTKLGVAPDVPLLSQRSRMKIESQDDRLPAGALAKFLDDMPEPVKRDESAQSRGNSTEARLNQKVTWEGATELPTGTTGSPIMGQF